LEESSVDDLIDDLFEGYMGDREKRRRENGLTIRPGRNKTLSKSQQMFNRLTHKISTLRQSIVSKGRELEIILLDYSKQIPGPRQAYAENQLALAKLIGASTKRIKYGKRQIEDIREVILDLCGSAFSNLIPDEETKDFYNEWSDTSYEEETEVQENEMKEAFAEQLRAMLGIDIDLSDFDETPEGFAEFRKKMEHEFAKAGQPWDDPFPKQKKTKKQLEKEEARKTAEEQQLKSIRNVYISLAKVLHPDAVADPEDRVLKEDLMKKVTSAYQAKDLATLLKLELEIVASDHSNFEKMSDAKLKIYIESLKDQVEALEMELESLPMHPRFMDISEYAQHPMNFAKRQISEQAREFTDLAMRYRKMTELCSSPNPRSHIMSFVKEYLAETKRENYFDPDLSDLYDLISSLQKSR
jgi:hypothetical protein